MSVNETLEENRDSEDVEARKKDLIQVKKRATRSQKVYMTVLVFMSLVMATLLIDVLPFTSSMKRDLFYSWQVVVLVVTAASLVLYRIWTDTLSSDSVSFVELDERNRIEKTRYSYWSPMNAGENARVVKEDATAQDHIQEVVDKSRKAASGYEFSVHMRTIIESLDHQIDYAEEKASRLLEVGRSFVRGGIWLYIFSIIVWQGYLYYINFQLSAGVIVGMVSTTAVFLIMEFLGSWYLKQYRHYGDSAFSYMKVRSSYNKYMLAYCVVVEFSENDPAKSQEDILRVLAESEKWPELKDVNANDFNYMLQSVETMGKTFEKLKGVFGRGNDTGTAL